MTEKFKLTIRKGKQSSSEIIENEEGFEISVLMHKILGDIPD